jgi:hypothetical protein
MLRIGNEMVRVVYALTVDSEIKYVTEIESLTELLNEASYYKERKVESLSILKGIIEDGYYYCVSFDKGEVVQKIRVDALYNNGF